MRLPGVEMTGPEVLGRRLPSARTAALLAAAAGLAGTVNLLLWWLVTRRRPVGDDVIGRMWHRESAPGSGEEPDRLTAAEAAEALEQEDPPPPGTPVPVVILHGLGMSSRSMVPLVRALGRYTRTLAPDMPGYGRSPEPRAGMLGVDELARAVLAWMDQAGVDEAVLVGHSLGAQVAGEVALIAPGRVRRLVVVAPTGDPERRSVLNLALHLGRDALREPPALIGVAVMDYLRAGPGQMVTLMGRAIRRAVEHMHIQVEVPLLVVRGEHDPVCRQGWCEDIVLGVPGSRLVVVPDAAHGVANTAPPRLVDLLRAEVRAAGPAA